MSKYPCGANEPCHPFEYCSCRLNRVQTVSPGTLTPLGEALVALERISDYPKRHNMTDGGDSAHMEMAAIASAALAATREGKSMSTDSALRDHFAGQAMQAFVAAFFGNAEVMQQVNDRLKAEGRLPDDGIAQMAYEQADAMLAARSK